MPMLRCPHCLRHIRIKRNESCPFCDHEVSPDSVLGKQVHRLLAETRTGALALTLAGGLSFVVACDDADEPSNNTNQEADTDSWYNASQNDYGGGDYYPNNDVGDSTEDLDAGDAGAHGDAGDAGDDSGDVGADSGDAGTDASSPDSGDAG